MTIDERRWHWRGGGAGMRSMGWGGGRGYREKRWGRGVKRMQQQFFSPDAKENGERRRGLWLRRGEGGGQEEAGR